jgi:hypothetical protein
VVLESVNVGSVANNVGREKFIESPIVGQNQFISAGLGIYKCRSLQCKHCQGHTGKKFFNNCFSESLSGVMADSKEDLIVLFRSRHP